MTMVGEHYGESVKARSVSLILTALKGCVRHYGHCFHHFHRHGLARSNREY